MGVQQSRDLASSPRSIKLQMACFGQHIEYMLSCLLHTMVCMVCMCVCVHVYMLSCLLNSMVCMCVCVYVCMLSCLLNSMVCMCAVHYWSVLLPWTSVKQYGVYVCSALLERAASMDVGCIPLLVEFSKCSPATTAQWLLRSGRKQHSFVASKSFTGTNHGACCIHIYGLCASRGVLHLYTGQLEAILESVPAVRA